MDNEFSRYNSKCLAWKIQDFYTRWTCYHTTQLTHNVERFITSTKSSEGRTSDCDMWLVSPSFVLRFEYELFQSGAWTKWFVSHRSLAIFCFRLLLYINYEEESIASFVNKLFCYRFWYRISTSWYARFFISHTPLSPHIYPQKVELRSENLHFLYEISFDSEIRLWKTKSFLKQFLMIQLSRNLFCTFLW